MATTQVEMPTSSRGKQSGLHLGESLRIGDYIVTMIGTDQDEVRLFVEPVSPNDDDEMRALSDQWQKLESDSDNWNEAKNQRRCDLIDKKYANGIAADGLTPDEQSELRTLQEQMERFRQQVAPLPLKATEALYQQLMAELGRVTERDGDVPV